MNKKLYQISSAVAVMAVLLTACGGAAASPTVDANLIYTAAAQTADARLTELVALTPSVTPVPPTATPDPAQTAAAQTAAAMLTQVALLTLTPPAALSPTVPPVSTGADVADYVADVTIPDGTDMAPGQTFVKTWRIQNNGSTTWTTDYDLVWVDGTQMGTVTEVALAMTVAPGAVVDISVNMTAPTALGSYTSYWKMRNAAGTYFNNIVTVVIDVVSGTVPTTAPGAATATPTATLTSGTTVSNLVMVANPPVYIGACPYTFSFDASFTLNQTVTLTYVLEAYSDSPGFTFNLPAAVTQTLSAGPYTLSFPLAFTSSGSGWVRLHITAPVNLTSNQATFSLTCQ